MNIDKQKAELRKAARIARAQAHVELAQTAATAIARIGLDFLVAPYGLAAGKFIPGVDVGASGIVSGYAAMPGELDTGPLLVRLHGDGAALALPVTVGKARPLLFRSWQPGDKMAAGFMGIKEPLETAAQVQPDIILLPLLAFDDRGYRLGYGGGHYDRTLQELRKLKPVIAIGLAYGEQKVDAVPHDRYDQQLDWIITPSDVHQFPNP